MSTPYQRIATGPTWSAIAPGEWNIDGLYGGRARLSIIQRLFRRFGGEFVDTLKNRPVSSNEGNGDRKSTRLNSSHVEISYAVFCLKKKKQNKKKKISQK